MGNNAKTNVYLPIMITLDVILASVVLFLLLNFQNNRLVELDRLNAELASLQSTKTRNSSVSKMVKDSKEERDRLNFYFITKETIPNFIEELESVAGRSGVLLRLDSLDVKKDAKQSNKGSYLRLNFRVDGNFSKVFHFLRVLENLPYNVRFNLINIARLESGSVNDIAIKGDVPWYGIITMDLISYFDK